MCLSPKSDMHIILIKVPSQIIVDVVPATLTASPPCCNRQADPPLPSSVLSAEKKSSPCGKIGPNNSLFPTLLVFPCHTPHVLGFAQATFVQANMFVPVAMF